MGRGLFLGGQPRPPCPPSQGGVALADANFAFLPYLCVHDYLIIPRTTKFGVVTHMGKGCFRQTATPLHLHKCTNASRDLSAIADFYHAMLCVSAVFAVARCPSVRSSVHHVGALYPDG